MNVSIAKSSSGNNTGSCATLVEYLNKENEQKELGDGRYFFSHDQDEVLSYTVEDSIDNNHRKLGKKDAKFYMLTINPSHKELQHINCNEKDLMAYTREVMEAYASNFNKDLKSKDLVWYAKIEEFRTDKKTKQKKPEHNWHIHVIVSRRDKEQRYKLSPLSNHINTSKGPVVGGFKRNSLRLKSEEIFDSMFDYKRDMKDSWHYQNTMKNGSYLEKDQLQQNLNSHENKPQELSNGLKDLGKAIDPDESEDFEIRKRRKKEQEKNQERGI